MAKLILLSQYRDAPAPSVPRGDRDLAPVAVLLWIASVIRVVLGMAERQSFDAEATLALGCTLFLPCWLLWSWARGVDDTDDDGNDGVRGAAVIEFAGKRRRTERGHDTGT